MIGPAHLSARQMDGGQLTYFFSRVQQTEDVSAPPCSRLTGTEQDGGGSRSYPTRRRAIVSVKYDILVGCGPLLRVVVCRDLVCSSSMLIFLFFSSRPGILLYHIYMIHNITYAAYEYVPKKTVPTLPLGHGGENDQPTLTNYQVCYNICTAVNENEGCVSSGSL